jgi:hypothetical protein
LLSLALTEIVARIIVATYSHPLKGKGTRMGIGVHGGNRHDQRSAVYGDILHLSGNVNTPMKT